MFETLSEKLTGTLRKVRGQGRMTEENLSQTLNSVKMALLEADVNYRVVKAFLRSVKERAIGQEVQGSLTPGQQFIKIVNEELTEMMGGANSGFVETEDTPLTVMMVGLQGSGKTSSVGKLARTLPVRRETTLFNSCRYIPACGHRTTSGIGRHFRCFLLPVSQ